MKSRFVAMAVLAAITAIAFLFLSACGGSGSSSVSRNVQPAHVNTSLSDPPTCASSTGGDFTSILVTIKDVQINASSTAGATDPGWIDLTPNLAKAPQQVDLLGIANNQCFLATLGSNTELQPGTYQQLRLILSTAAISGDKCNGAVNCIVLASDSSVHPLLLSSEAQTGIKIPSASIAGGGITVAEGETKDLNIDFDGCASIVINQGNGQYRLKPVLHAGIVSTTSSSITGLVVDQTTNKPLVGATGVVALEQNTNGVDRVVRQTLLNPDGTFIFCPVETGATFDVVIAAISAGNVAYGATITTGVKAGDTLANIPLYPTTGTSTGPASITGTVSSASSSGAAAADLTIGAMQQVTLGSAAVSFTIPLPGQAPPSATATVGTAPTGPSLTCSTNTDCAKYTLAVPALNPAVGAFAATGTTYTAGASGSVTYIIEVQAFNPAQSGQQFCSAPVQSTTPVMVSAGQTANAPPLAFNGCQ